MDRRLLDTWGKAPEVRWTAGDGTVPLESALADAAVRAVLPADRSHQHVVPDAIDHVKILNTPQVLQILDSYLGAFN